MKIDSELTDSYENMPYLTYEQADALPNNILYKDLPTAEVSGVLKASRYVDGELKQLYSTKENHVGVIAATRLGKTTSYVVPTILSFARQKNKRGMVISDPKGELYRLTAATLTAEGYRVMLLNFRDRRHSECWNMLSSIFRKYKNAIETAKEVKLIMTKDGSYRNEFRGKVYESQVELDRDIEIEKSMAIDEVGNDIDSIALIVVPTYNTRDPYWEDSAREVLKAYLWAMLEDSANTDNPITEDTYSFATVLNIMSTMRDGGDNDCGDSGYFSDRPQNSRARQFAQSILENGRPTRKCIISSLDTKLSPFRAVIARTVTSCNSFEMKEITDAPTAIFISYRDEVAENYQLIGMFVQDAYRTLIEYADAQPDGKLKTPFYFILDEFGNFPRIPSFEVTISACAGRNIYFILIIQSYAQLNNVYGSAIAEIIRDNLNMHVFFGSNNPDTLEVFSRECGQKTRLSPLSAINGKGETIENYQFETIPLVTKSRLAHFEPGECIITEANSGYVLFSKLERYYMCDEFNHLPQSNADDYYGRVNPCSSRYIYIHTPKRHRSYYGY